MSELIIVDSNIIFSSILNVDSNISRILLNNTKYTFLTPQYSSEEIIKHKEKILKIGKLSERQFYNNYILIYSKLNLIEHTSISKESYNKAFELCENIDVDDIVFVAFAIQFNCNLWTGDKKLINGLKKLKFNNIVLTKDLMD